MVLEVGSEIGEHNITGFERHVTISPYPELGILRSRRDEVMGGQRKSRQCGKWNEIQRDVPQVEADPPSNLLGKTGVVSFICSSVTTRDAVIHS
jgi:hypothetical protein